jgi:hypothetical protein
MINSKASIITAALFALILTTQCDNGVKPEDNVSTGTLQFDYTVINSLAKSVIADTNTCKLIDLKSTVYSIEVASGTVTVGGTDNLDWKTIYESTSEMLGSQRVFPSVVLPVNTYNCIRIKQKNRLWWVCEFGGNVIELPDLNARDVHPDSMSAINVFSDSGLYTYESNGKFTMMTPNEKLGGFEIRNAQTTNLTLVMNINTLDWIDADSSLTWTEGDDLDNWMPA